MLPLARVPRRKSLSEPRRAFRRLEKLASTWRSRLNLGMTLRTPPHKRRHLSLPHEISKAVTTVLGSAAAREDRSAKQRRGGLGQKKVASNEETSLTLKHTQAEKQELRQRCLTSLVPQSWSVGHESSRHSGDRAASAACKRNITLSPALQDDELEFSKFSLAALLCFALIIRRAPSHLVLFGQQI